MAGLAAAAAQNFAVEAADIADFPFELDFVPVSADFEDGHFGIEPDQADNLAGWRSAQEERLHQFNLAIGLQRRLEWRQRGGRFAGGWFEQDATVPMRSITPQVMPSRV